MSFIDLSTDQSRDVCSGKQGSKVAANFGATMLTEHLTEALKFCPPTRPERPKRTNWPCDHRKIDPSNKLCTICMAHGETLFAGPVTHIQSIEAQRKTAAQTSRRLAISMAFAD
nr:hypothetical protein [uncultured Devosia sp.]